GGRPRISEMRPKPQDRPIASSPAPVLEPQAAPEAAPAAVMVPRALMYALVAIAAVSLVASGMLWQRLSNIQEHLARHSQDSGNNALEARTLAKQAQEIARDTAARQAVLDQRLGEVALQRTQVEELV